MTDSKTKRPTLQLMERLADVLRDNSTDSIHDATKIPTSWIRKLKAGTIKNPGVVRVELILNTFKG